MIMESGNKNDMFLVELFPFPLKIVFVMHTRFVLHSRGNGGYLFRNNVRFLSGRNL